MSVSLISTISESSVEVANRALTDQEKALQGKGSRALVCEGKNGTYPRLGLKGWSRNAHVFAGAALLGQVNSCPQADLNRESLGRVCALAAFAVAWLMISAHESTISSSMKRILDLNLEECRWPVPLQGPNSRLFCAQRTPKRGLPYCETHMRCAYQNAQLRKRS